MTFDGPLLADRWRLGPRMGSGGQARTYLARDEQADGERIVVLKQLRIGSGERTWKSFDLFEREVRTLESLDHRGIPVFVDSFESEPGTFNLVMERAPGASLRAWSAKRKLGEGDLVDILRRALEILDYLHGRTPPVIHRDIKPANLVRDRDGALSLVDFGGVRDALRPEGGSTVIGTFGYMAPEQLHGHASPATDIYGLGATVIALAGGVEPEKVPRKGLRMDLDRHLPRMDADLRRVLATMVEPDPDDRPQTAREVLALLDAGPAPASRKKPPPHRHAPPPEPESRALARRDALPGVDVARDAVDEIAEFTSELPAPIGWLLRLLLFCIGASGWLSFTIIRYAMLPLLFALISVVTSDSSRPKLRRARLLIGDGFDEARDGFRTLALGRRPSKRLPPADDEP